MSDINEAYAIMFADVAGSTRLYETLGDTAAKSAIDNCINTMREITDHYSGTVIKTIGDEIMCRFDSASDVTNTACSIQEAMELAPASNGVKLSVRIGYHYGPAILQTDGDIFGDAVNVAARMAGIAKGRQIITTDDTTKLLPPELKEKTRYFDRAPVKGKQKEIIICEVVWEQEDVTRMATMSSMPVAQTNNIPPLQIRSMDKEANITSETSAFSFGRGNQCSMTIPSTLASRSHCQIEYRRGKFILIDQSTNGTYVRMEDGQDVYLKREEIPLWGIGVISLGETIQEDNPLLIHFNAS